MSGLPRLHIDDRMIVCPRCWCRFHDAVYQQHVGSLNCARRVFAAAMIAKHWVKVSYSWKKVLVRTGIPFEEGPGAPHQHPKLYTVGIVATLLNYPACVLSFAGPVRFCRPPAVTEQILQNIAKAHGFTK